MDSIKTSDSATLSNFIWKIADDLWGDFKHTDFVRIIIPLLLLRRLECVLEPTKDVVLKEYDNEKDSGIDLRDNWGQSKIKPCNPRKAITRKAERNAVPPIGWLILKPATGLPKLEVH